MSDDTLDFVLRKVERLVRETPASADRRKEILSAVFELNNEIGRRVREDKGTKQKLIPLQQCVNALTVAVKKADAKAMEDSVMRAFQALAMLAE